MKQTNGKALKKIRAILEDLLDLDGREISGETYLIRDLGAESIDLLELAVSLNREFGINVLDSEVFLWRLRVHLADACKSENDEQSYIAGKYPHLDSARISEILTDLDKGPALKVKDIVSYVNYHREGARAD
ncbi:MAG: phosphopantetheine-binding protein [Syntrophaceae bacterium]